MLKILTAETTSHLGSLLPRFKNLLSHSSRLSFLQTEDRLSSKRDVLALCFELWRVYGDDEALLRRKLETLQKLARQFELTFGDGPVGVMRAPARINILGEHIDYVSYLPTVSLTFGSREHDMIMLFRANKTGQIRGSSTDQNFPQFNFSLTDGPQGGNEDNWLGYLLKQPPLSPHWRNYVMGAAFFALHKYGTHIQTGFDFMIDSSIPPGGGASSSSALLVLAGAAIRSVNQISFEPEELARDSAQAEWFIGTRGGAMDHLAICLAKKNHVLRTAHHEQDVRHVPLVDESLRWVTFFTHPAEKGSRVMVEYNERAFVSRLLIPALVAGWKTTAPERAKQWAQAHEDYKISPEQNVQELKLLLSELPETSSLSEVKTLFPEVFAEGARLFPGLFKQTETVTLKVRSRALHHIGEVERVNKAQHILSDARVSDNQPNASAMRAIGLLLSESHRSLRDLYEVSTSEIEDLLNVILSDREVYGARLMGGGFGGTILTLTTERNVPALIELVQRNFYAPRSRQALQEKAIMISTPGAGLGRLDFNSLWREASEEFAALGSHALQDRALFNSILDRIILDEWPTEGVQPIIVAAGGGTRAIASGLSKPKPLASINGRPSIKHVLENLRASTVFARPPIVIVSPETEAQVREALADEEIVYVVQPVARGTGDAVWQANEVMGDFRGLVVVVWSTQPVITPQTIKRTLKLAALFREDYAMVFPTALKDHPYAPLYRDEAGRVRSSRETHLEGALRPAFGETNLGLFVLRSEVMFAALDALRERYWKQAENLYERRNGELGFPNEMIDFFSARGDRLFACPLADPREEQGIKTLADVARCEQYIRELTPIG